MHERRKSCGVGGSACHVFAVGPFQALGEADHCNGEAVSVDCSTVAKAGGEQELAIAGQFKRALDGLNRESCERNQVIALVLCSFAWDQPSSLLGLVEFLKFILASASNFTCPRRRQQR